MTDEQLRDVLKCVQERDEWKAKAEAAYARGLADGRKEAAEALSRAERAEREAMVYKAEVDAWRENDRCCGANAGKAIHRTLHLEPAMDATDALTRREGEKP